MLESETPKNSIAAASDPCSEPTADQLANPEEGLQALKAFLQCRQSEVDIQTKKRDALKDDIGVLENAANNLKQILDDYSQAFPAFQTDFKALQDYLANKKRMIEVALGDKKGSVDKVIQDFDSEATSKQDDLNKKFTAQDEASKQYDVTQATLKQKQEKFDSFKQLKGDLQKNIQEIKQLKGSIEQEDEKSNTANMYFYAGELKTIMDKINVLSIDQVKQSLYQAWKELYDAKKDVSEKKLTWDLKKADYEAAQKALGTPDEQKQNRRQEILKNLSDLNKT